MKRKIEKGEFIFVFILLISSLMLFVLSFQIYKKDPRISGPGSFPLFISILLIIILNIILWTIKKRGNKLFEEEKSLNKLIKKTLNYLFPQKIILLILLVIIYAIFLPNLGFTISTFLFLFLSMLLFVHDRKNIIKIFIISTLSIISILIIFSHIFKIVLP
ncbi:MAG: tripartite tricarboxylate transporter TctB family protein [Eubacteriaceae bacterium]